MLKLELHDNHQHIKFQVIFIPLWNLLFSHVPSKELPNIFLIHCLRQSKVNSYSFSSNPRQVNPKKKQSNEYLDTSFFKRRTLQMLVLYSRLCWKSLCQFLNKTLNHNLEEIEKSSWQDDKTLNIHQHLRVFFFFKDHHLT